MVQPITINENWSDTIQEIAQKFNKYAKKSSLRMVSFSVDKAFDILSDDENRHQVQAAEFLKKVRKYNPKLISSYISTLLDSVLERHILSNEDFIVPNYKKYPIPQSLDEDIRIIDENNSLNEDEVSEDPIVEDSKKDNESKELKESKGEEDKDPQIIEDENLQSNSMAANSKQTSEKSEDNILTWDMQELIEFKIIKNLKRISLKNVESPIKKCAAGDGEFEEGDVIWRCVSCGTAYHENCAKIIAIYEGKCRICDNPFYEEETT